MTKNKTDRDIAGEIAEYYEGGLDLFLSAMKMADYKNGQFKKLLDDVEKKYSHIPDDFAFKNGVMTVLDDIKNMIENG